MKGISNLFEMNPGLSRDTVTSFPMAATKSLALWRTSPLVWRAGMISTRRMTETGLKKCTPSTRPADSSPSGALDALAEAAMAVREMEDVLLARMAVDERCVASSRKMACLTDKRSTAASIANSHEASPAISETVWIRERVSSDSFCVIFPRETSLARSESGERRTRRSKRVKTPSASGSYGWL